jgi:hypothetical protein
MTAAWERPAHSQQHELPDNAEAAGSHWSNAGVALRTNNAECPGDAE